MHYITNLGASIVSRNPPKGSNPFDTTFLVQWVAFSCNIHELISMSEDHPMWVSVTTTLMSIACELHYLNSSSALASEVLILDIMCSTIFRIFVLCAS